MSSLPHRTDILIVGAGPCGLATALSLRKQGCNDITVVDCITTQEHTSRALAVHAATLEALDEIGCAEPLISEGIKANGPKLWDGQRFHAMGDFSTLASYSKYPFVLLVPQHITERVLADRVHEEGINVHRPFKAIGLKVDELNPDITNVVFEDGQVVQARYVVGADGSKSIVRGEAGIHYADPDGEGGASELKQAIVADVTFSSPPPASRDEILFILSSGNFFLCIPLPPSGYEGQEVWRIGTGIPMGAPPHSPSTEYLQGVVDAYGPGRIPQSAMPNLVPLKIEKTIWSTRFRTHSAISSTPFARLSNAGGVVILVGDAAHLHPPAGGQGMNLGLRDAVFLGPVLAEHLKRSVHVRTPSERAQLDEPLKKWAESRHAQALKIIALAKRILGGASWKDEITWYFGVIPVNWAKVRSAMLGLASLTGYTKKMVPWALSGLANR